MTALLPAPTLRARRPGRRLALAGLVAVVAIAYAIRLHLITAGAGLTASDGYDDGVYYAAADAFVHGRLPYRDFLLLHPPGIVLALAPFAALGAVAGDPVGVAAARLAFVGIGAVNSGLIALLAARHSRSAAAIAGLTAAAFFPLAYAERSTLLEPLGTLLLTAGLLVALRGGPRAAVLGGVVAGAACDVKIWYVVPVLLLAVTRTGHRGRFAGGAVAGAVAIGLPFLLEAPVSAVREVVLDQLGRPRIRESLTGRLLALTGDPFARLHGTGSLRDADRAAVVVLVLVVVAAAAAWQVREARTHLLLTAATGAVLLATPSFYPHYVAFTAPWAILVLGIGASVLLGRLRRRGARAVLAAGLVAVVVGTGLPSYRHLRLHPQPVAALAPLLADVRGCVQSDDPGLLADAGVLSRDLARGCALRPDVTGATYDRDAQRRDGREVPRTRDAAFQRDVLRYLTSGDAVVVARRGTDLDAAGRRAIRDLPVLGTAGGLTVHRTR